MPAGAEPRSRGEPLLWPNDICVGPDGALYVTDSGLLVDDLLADVVANEVRDDWEDLTVDGQVIRFDPRSGEARSLDRGIQFTNGIAFGPDGLLYVNETFTGRHLPLPDRGRRRRRRARSCSATSSTRTTPQRGMRGPDGMAFSDDGRLWVTVSARATSPCSIRTARSNGGSSSRAARRQTSPSGLPGRADLHHRGRKGDARKPRRRRRRRTAVQLTNMAGALPRGSRFSV